jgi:hypothetical protein
MSKGNGSWGSRTIQELTTPPVWTNKGAVNVSPSESVYWRLSDGWIGTGWPGKEITLPHGCGIRNNGDGT